MDTNSDKRKTERHLMEETISLTGSEGIIPARTVDVSRDGMRVIVNRPDGFHGIQRVTVQLPGAGGEGIPCNIRRSEEDQGNWIVGLEFDGMTDARLLLIERWLESLKMSRSIAESAPTESRQVPRTRCTLSQVHCTNKDIDILAAEDISVDGMLLKVRGAINSGDSLSLSMKLPDSNRNILFIGHAAYVIDEGDDKPFSVGLAVDEMKSTDRNRLRNFIIEIASGAALLEHHKLLEKEQPSEEFRVDGPAAHQMVECLAASSATVNLLDETGMRILETRVETIGDGHFTAPSPAAEGGTAFFSFTQDGASYTFSAERIDCPGGLGVFGLPSYLYRGEKRSGRRQSTDGDVKITWSSSQISNPNAFGGRLLDASRRGFLCEISPAELGGKLPIIGQPLIFSVAGKSQPGEIRHVAETMDRNGRMMLRLGVETGITRQEPRLTVYDRKKWELSWHGNRPALGEERLIRAESVEYHDSNGRRISALLHITEPGSSCVAVVIPPAFGKKKEVLAPLALTLMAHFFSAGENVAVLRYDGIDRPGESDNANRHARRGYEMLGYRIDQGYEDLVASMNWVRSNPYFTASKVALISTSMAALDARRLMASPDAPHADYWVSLMGVSSAQGTLRNILGGMDVIANHRMGLPIGTMGMLGQLIDMDRMAADMTRLGYATAGDAREAMARIDVPVTWIYGSYDKWMIPEEIRDVMSVAAPADRELIEIPTAHNLRTSEDALSAFQLISDAILRRLLGKTVPAVAPDKKELLDLLTRERERIVEKEKLDTQSYWKGYLVGEGEGEEGYDFFRRLSEFREFLQLQASLLDPRPGLSIADIGCGTGLVCEALLSRLAATKSNLEGTRFTGIDLVPEALRKAEEKFILLSRAHPQLVDIKDSWIARDMEPDSLAPLRLLRSSPQLGIDFLRERVKGLRAETVDHLTRLPEEDLGPILRGCRISDALRRSFEKEIGPADMLSLEDLNRAARFIIEDLDEEDLKPSRRQGTGRINRDRQEHIRSSDLSLAVLDFGDWNRLGKLPFPDASFDLISASLFLSYLFAPDIAVQELHRMLQPGGKLLVSSMIPDSDISGIFTRYISEQSTLDAENAQSNEREHNLREARTMLNEAASLFSLEEDGWFQFFDESQLITMMRNADFTDIRSFSSLGNPAQAIIVIGTKKIV